MTTSTSGRFPWRRWWYAEGDEPPTTAGFLDDPAGPMAKYFDYSLVELDSLDAARCVVQLGEPGIGKSTELSRAEERLAAAGVPVARFDLGRFPDFAALHDEILADQRIVAWMASSADLVLMLDGFDEANAALGRLAEGLMALLGKLPTERLKLRITSRSSVWSRRLDDELGKTWPDVQRLVLAPLTPRDVAVAAQTRLGADDFLSAVDERDIGVLAARPLTLDMLFKVREQQGILPLERTELYERATTVLAAENHPRRVEERTARLSGNERLALARRLAAASLLSGRTVIHRTRTAHTPDGDLALDDLVHTRAEEDALIEVLDTGLFTAAAAGAVRWTHRSIAEFLAAQELAGLPVTTIQYLLSDPFTADRITPSLAGVATWVAALNPQVYTWLVECEPDMLLTANLLTASDHERQELTLSLLRDLERGTPVDRRRYRNLAYPGMGADVAPYLAPHRERWMRRVAAHILADAKCRELDERLVEILEAVAADHPQDYLGADIGLATTVVFALDDCTNVDLLDRLLLVVATPDAPWQLRAEILDQLWGRIATGPLLAAVADMDLPSHPERRLGRAVAEGLATAVRRGRVALPAVIEWLSNTAFHQVQLSQLSSAWRTVVEATALEAAETDDIRDAQLQLCAEMAQAWLHKTHELFDSHSNDPRALSDDARHRLAHAWWSLTPDNYDLHHLVTGGVLQANDLEWLLRELGQADPASPHASSVTTVIVFFAIPDEEQAAVAAAVAADTPTIGQFVADRFSVEQVQAATDERVKREQEQAAKDAARGPSTFDSQRLAAAVAASDWPAIARELQLPGGRDQWAYGASLTHSPAWATLSPPTRHEVANAAAAHLAALSANPSAGAADEVGQAFELLNTEDAQRLDAVDRDTLLAWLTVLRERIGADDAVNAMVDWLAASHAHEIETLLLDGIARDASTKQFPFHLRHLGQFTSPAIVDAADTLAKDTLAAPALVSGALAALIRRDPTRGIQSAFTIIGRRPAVKPSHNLVIDPTNAVLLRWRQSVAACAAIIESDQCAAHLDQILTALSTSTEFAVDVVATTESSGNLRPWNGLTCDQLATLHLWACTTLPPEPDHPSSGVVPSNPVHEFAGAVLRSIQERAEPDAVDALNRIADERDYPWARSAAVRIANQLREAHWQPLPPADVLAVIDEPGRRVIASEAQLAQLLLEAIEDIQAELDGSPDFAALFWHRQHAPKGQATTWMPRSEVEFATALLHERLDRKLHGVVLRQEAQLNLRYGDTEGSELDIEAVVLHHGAEICVIVEVKGLWHPDVATAIEEQLADRYLTGQRSATGIYLVGAFETEHWYPDDWRRAACCKRNISELAASLDADAKRLSTDGRTVHARIMLIRI